MSSKLCILLIINHKRVWIAGRSFMSQKNYDNKNNVFNLSNQLVKAKYIMSPLAKDLMSIGITRIEETGNPLEPLEARIYNNELFEIIGSKRKKNIARDLTKACNEMQSCKIIINDDNGGFDSYVIAPTCSYHSGLFTIKFNPSLAEHTIVLDKYTQCSLTTSTMLNKFFTKRLYEILKEQYYRLNPKDMNDYIIKQYDYYELKFMLGLANQQEEEVEKYVKKCKREHEKIDWEYAYKELAKEKIHERWDSFKYRVLDEAKKDINKIAELRFNYVPIYTKHKKIIAIKFIIYPNNPGEEVEKERNKRLEAIKNRESELFKNQEMTSYICDRIAEDFKDHEDIFGKTEIENFVKDAKGDEELVRWAILDTDRYSETTLVRNYVGCVRDRIKNPDNYRQIPVMNGSAEQGQQMVDFMDSFNKEKPALAIKTWNKIQKSNLFEDFKTYVLNELEMSIEEFNESVTCKEKIDVFLDWKKENGIVGD